MKTLDQIESRTVIPGGTAAYIIFAPGSYVLGGNITVANSSGIVISVGNVTLDLNGFTISSTHPIGYGSGIDVGSGQALTNIRITNGHINSGSAYNPATKIFSSAGFGAGVYAGASSLNNLQIDHVTVTGVTLHGIYASNASVDHCRVNICGSVGILGGIVSECAAQNCVEEGILAESVSNSKGASVGSTVGADGVYAKTVSNSIGVADAGPGIAADIIMNSKGTSVSGYGITGKVVSYSYGSSTSGTAIYAGQSAIGCAVGTGAILVGTPSGKQLNTP